ncbi:MAG: radical SAM protein [Sporomusaceae bacterium]|nr:radical SAM protein [Sporomusaceae bacterium]
MTMWKVSAGTAAVMGKKRLKSDAMPTTAYVMLGEDCQGNCSFCAQSRQSSGNKNYLSRITWPQIAETEAASAISAACAGGSFKRICLQVVNSQGSMAVTLQALSVLTAEGKGELLAPICASNYIVNCDQAGELLAAGAEKVCLALDAASPAVFAAMKGGDFSLRRKLLSDCAATFPGRMATHLIIGLGETEKEAVQFLADCLKEAITVGLFAFTPVAGTPLANRKPPEIGVYRRIQMAYYLLQKGFGYETILFHGDRISGFNQVDILSVFASGKAFETSGCKDCNRPYYNERPGGTIYNYPRPLSDGEILQAIRESGIGGEGQDALACC